MRPWKRLASRSGGLGARADSNALMPLALIMTLYYTVFRPIEWLAYLRGLSLLGLGVACVWGPLTILGWRRRASKLLFEWNLMGKPSRGRRLRPTV